jgi:hypothetical protein
MMISAQARSDAPAVLAFLACSTVRVGFALFRTVYYAISATSTLDSHDCASCAAVKTTAAICWSADNTVKRSVIAFFSRIIISISAARKRWWSIWKVM